MFKVILLMSSRNINWQLLFTGTGVCEFYEQSKNGKSCDVICERLVLFDLLVDYKQIFN